MDVDISRARYRLFDNADLDAMFDARALIQARAATGGTSSASVQAQLAELSATL